MYIHTCMYIYIYIYRERERDVYTYVYVYIYIYIHIYIYIYNPHLGLINAFFLCFSSKRPLSLLIYYQTGHKHTKYGQDVIKHISPLMGGPLCENQIWDFYTINVT